MSVMSFVKLQSSTKISRVVIIFLLFAVLFFTNTKTVSASSVSLEPTRDTYVDSSLPNSSFGNLGLGTIKNRPTDSSVAMSLLHFDLSSIPAGSTISSANLRMRLGGCIGNFEGSGHIAPAAYVANGSPAWTESSTYSQLSTSGSSIDAFSSQYISCSPGSYFDIDLKPILSYWVDGTIPNDGLIITRINGGDYWTRVFYMSEATESSRPKLTVTYDVPYESVPTPDGPPATPETSTSSEPTAKKSEGNTVVAEATPESIAPDLTIEPAAKLTAKQEKDKTSVVLSWDASKTKDIKAYRIYRKIAGEKTYSKIAEVDATKREFLDTKTKSGLQHSYFIRVVRGDSESLNSPTASIVIQSKAVVSAKVVVKESGNTSWVWLIIAAVLLLISLIAYKKLHTKHKKLHAKHKELVDSTKQNRR